jgi:pyruvate dehydrogenase (quinone)
VVLPYDVQTAPAPDPAAQEHGVLVTGPGPRPARVVPHDADVRAAANEFGITMVAHGITVMP